MVRAKSSLPGFLIVALTTGLLATFVTSMRAQEPQPVNVGNSRLAGLPEDWSHRHVIFTDPGTADEAMRNGKYDEWFKIVNDPRYVMQQMKRGEAARGPFTEDVRRYHEAREGNRRDERERHDRDRDGWDRTGGEKKKHEDTAINGDWSMDIGVGATVGVGHFPAKFAFDTTAAVNCGTASLPDYVVYNTSVAGSSSQASVVAYDNLYATTCPGEIPSVYWAFNTGGTVQTSVVLSEDGLQLAFIQTPSSGNAQLVLLKPSKTPTGRNLISGTTNITNVSKNFTVTAGLTSMDVGAVISGTGIPVGDTIATVTSATAGTLFTAASGNGTAAEALSISADAGGPDTLTSVGASSYHGCTAPCMVTLTFTGTTRNDTLSSPYYDYGSDTLYAGDSAGGLHKFTNVFKGTPTEVGSPWVALGTTAVGSPVYDSTSGNVFAGDASGFVYSVNSAGTKTTSFQVAVAPGIVDAPIVDSTHGQLWVTVSKDLNLSATTSACGVGLACSGVIQLPTNFTATTKFTESVMGVTSANTVWDGAFDNLYWSGVGTGNMYVSTTNGAGRAKLEEIPLTAAVFATQTAACQTGFTLPTTNMSSEDCSINIDNPFTSGTATAGAAEPVTEIYNTTVAGGPIDFIFTSEPTTGGQTGCAVTTGCLYSWNVTSPLAANAAAKSGAAESGGTSGIIVDNTLSTTGASQIYFSTLTNSACATSGSVPANSGCAVQASQSGLN